MSPVTERRAVPTSSFSQAETDELYQEVRALVAEQKRAVAPPSSADELMKDIMADMDVIRGVIAADDRVGLIYDDQGEDLIGALTVIVKAAMDSGACASVINPDDLPAGVVPSGNPTGAVFHGANNSPIRRFGSAVTRMRNKTMDVGCRWQVAEVSRPLNAVSEVCGPMGPVGLQDVLFNNNTCYVVPPGVVAKIMEHIQAVAEYPREGNLYLAEIELSSFARQDPAK